MNCDQAGHAWILIDEPLNPHLTFCQHCFLTLNEVMYPKEIK